MSGFIVFDANELNQILAGAICHKCEFNNKCLNFGECIFPAYWEAEKRATPLYQMCDKDGKLVEPYRSLIVEEKEEFDA